MLFEEDKQLAMETLRKFYLGLQQLSGPSLVELHRVAETDWWNCCGHTVSLSEGETVPQIVFESSDSRLNNFDEI